MNVILWRSFQRAVLWPLVCALLIAPYTSGAQTRRRFTIPYRPVGDSGSPLISVQLPNGLSGNFVFDTGADISVLTETMADRLGLRPKPAYGSDGRPLLLDAGRPAQVVQTTARFGGVAYTGPFLVVPEQALAIGTGPPVDGLIGAETLARFAVLFNFKRHEITLLYPGKLPPDEISRLDMAESFVIPRASTDKLPFHVTARLNDRVDADLVIDTGGATTYLPLSAVRQLKLKPQQRGLRSRTVYGDLKKNRTTLKTLTLGPMVFKEEEVEYSEQEQDNFPPHIGMSILAWYYVLIDFPANTLYMKPGLRELKREEARIAPQRETESKP